MCMKAERLKLYLPSEHKKDLFAIDFTTLKEKGFTTLFFDLDNTIADYDTIYPSDEMKSFFNTLKELGFDIHILSNNKGKRVKRFEESLNVKAYHSLYKPFLFRLKKHLLIDKLEKDKIVWIGDQLVTDIKCANKLNIYSILVNALNKDSEKWYTRLFNRKIERNKLKRIKKYLNNEYINLGLNDL